MKPPIGYGKNKFGELKEYFLDNLSEEEIDELNTKGITSRRDEYGDDHYIHSSKETFKLVLSSEYFRDIERLKQTIENSRKTILWTEQKQIELDRF